MDLAMIALGFANRRTVARVGKRSRRAGGNRTQTSGRTTDPRIWLKRLHRRQRRHRGEQSLTSRASPGAYLGALFLVEQSARVVDRLGGDVEDQAVSRLTEHIAPVVTGGPQLRVLEREGDCPDDGEGDEVVIGEKRDRNEDGIDRQVWRKFAAERHYHWRVPLAQLLGGRLRRRVWRLCRRRVAIAQGLGELTLASLRARSGGARRRGSASRKCRHRAAIQSHGKCGGIRKAIDWIFLEAHHH